MTFISDLLQMLDEIEKECMTQILKKEYNTIRNKQFSHVKTLYDQYKEIFELKINENTEYGLNLVFHGRYGEYLFPILLFDVNSYKTTKEEIVLLQERKFTSILELEGEMFNIIIKNFTEQQGYSIEMAECLHFYIHLFNASYIEGDTNYLLQSYKTRYLTDFTEKISKKYNEIMTKTFRDYPIPEMKYWNLGSIIFPDDENNTTLPIFPYWVLSNEKKNILVMHRISPKLFTSKFEYRDNIVTKISYFINLNNLKTTKNQNYIFNIPDLFECYDLLTKQEFEYKEYSKYNNTIQAPNWVLSVDYPKKIIQERENILNEQKELFQFILTHEDIVIHLFNTHRSNDLELGYILSNPDKRNIFTNMFLNRLRIEKAIQAFTKIVLWIKFARNHRPKSLNQLQLFLQAIYPDGIVIDYQTGLVMYVEVTKAGYKTHIEQLHGLLELFGVEYTIHEEFENQGLLQYTLPPANYYNVEEKTWEFPERTIKIPVKEFTNTSGKILENETKFAEKNAERIQNFSTRIKNL